MNDQALQRLARTGGALYLIIIALGLFEEAGVRSRIIVSGDAAATAVNLRELATLWRLGIAAEFILLICAVALTMIFYVLLKPVSRELALLAVFFNLVSIAVEATAALHLWAALPPGASALQAAQAHSRGFAAALIFFGCECLVLGTLIFKSGFLPKAIGVLMQIAGASYLINSFTLLLAPEIARQLFPAILIPAFIGEAALCLWLLVKGVSAHRNR